MEERDSNLPVTIMACMTDRPVSDSLRQLTARGRTGVGNKTGSGKGSRSQSSEVDVAAALVTATDAVVATGKPRESANLQFKKPHSRPKSSEHRSASSQPSSTSTDGTRTQTSAPHSNTSTATTDPSGGPDGPSGPSGPGPSGGSVMRPPDQEQDQLPRQVCLRLSCSSSTLPVAFRNIQAEPGLFVDTTTMPCHSHFSFSFTGPTGAWSRPKTRC